MKRETAEVHSIIIKCDAIDAELAECVEANEAWLASLKKRHISKRDGEGKLGERERL